MPVTVFVPSFMSQHTAGQTSLVTSGATVRAALDELCERFPEITYWVFDDASRQDRRVWRSLGIFLNDEQVDNDRLDAPVGDNGEIVIVPMVGGATYPRMIEIERKKTAAARAAKHKMAVSTIGH